MVDKLGTTKRRLETMKPTTRRQTWREVICANCGEKLRGIYASIPISWALCDRSCKRRYKRK